MIRKITIITLLLFTSCMSSFNGLKKHKDAKNGSVVYVGMGNRALLENEESFYWFKNGLEKYKPNKEVVDSLKPLTNGLFITIVAATWCSDTKELLPKFYNLCDALGIAESQIKLYLVDRDKKTKDGIENTYNITKVPTLLFFENNILKGKIEETVQTSIEQDLLHIIKHS